MSKTPLVSIIIPCYNHEKFLDDCLLSVIEQDYKNIELLICDDASPDNSYEKILSYKEKLEKRFSRVEILKNDNNCGVTKNINRMLSVSKGTFVKTLASDDCMAPTAISKMVNYLLSNETVDVVISNGITVLESERYPNLTPQGRIYDTPPDLSDTDLFVRTAKCNRISAPAAMVRQSVYEKHGYYDETLKVEDYEFWLRIISQGVCRFGFLDENLIYYRINANSMTSMVNNSDLAKRRKAFHSSELKTLLKFKDKFPPDIYAEIVVEKILNERYLAVSYNMNDWERELRLSFKSLKEKKSLPVLKKVKYNLFYTKQNLKFLLKKANILK